MSRRTPVPDSPPSGQARRSATKQGALSRGELLALPAIVDLATAARAFGLGRTRAYELARAGRFPCRVLRINNTYRIPTAELLAVLGIDPEVSGREDTEPGP